MRLMSDVSDLSDLSDRWDRWDGWDGSDRADGSGLCFLLLKFHKLLTCSLTFVSTDWRLVISEQKSCNP